MRLDMNSICFLPKIIFFVVVFMGLILGAMTLSERVR